MNPVYSPASTGVPFTNTKGIGYPGNLKVCRVKRFKLISIITMQKVKHISAFFLVTVAGFPVGYAAAAPAYTPNVYAGANPAFPSGKNEVLLNT